MLLSICGCLPTNNINHPRAPSSCRVKHLKLLPFTSFFCLMGSSFCSPSGILAQERKLCRDLVHSNKKEQEFRSIFHHIQSAQSQRSPSELFAQHIVTIVHHVRGGSGVCVSSGKVHSSLAQIRGVCALKMPGVVFQQIFHR